MIHVAFVWTVRFFFQILFHDSSIFGLDCAMFYRSIGLHDLPKFFRWILMLFSVIGCVSVFSLVLRSIFFA